MRYSSKDDLLNDIMHVIEQYYENPRFNIRQLADDLAIEQSSLRRWCRTLLGTSPIKLIKKYRIERAKEKLLQGELCQQVAWDVGFSQHRSFSTVFKKEVGICPSKFSASDVIGLNKRLQGRLSVEPSDTDILLEDFHPIESIGTDRDIFPVLNSTNHAMINTEDYSINTHRNISTELNNQSYALMSADDYLISPTLTAAKQRLWSDFNDLVPDDYLRNNAQFRVRRFANFYFQPCTGEIKVLPHTPYFQEENLNSYTGGIQRKLARLKDSSLTNSFLHELIKFNFRHFPLAGEMAEHSWLVDVHQIRTITTPDEEGEPTPEGIHHDENDFICMHLANSRNIADGINTIYDNKHIPLESFTLHNPMDSVMIRHSRAMNGVSPVQPQNPSKNETRDMLLIGYNYAPDLELPAALSSG